MARTATDFDVGFGHLGNGLTVWNRKRTEHGDYEIVAHIAPDRTVTIRKNDLPREIIDHIFHVAATSTMTISATQDAPVFRVPPLVETAAS